MLKACAGGTAVDDLPPNITPDEAIARLEGRIAPEDRDVFTVEDDLLVPCRTEAGAVASAAAQPATPDHEAAPPQEAPDAPRPVNGHWPSSRLNTNLVMQYVPGVSLQQRIDREGPLAVIEVLRIGMQVASGLAAAHAQGLVHRDIKPANILLENGVERVKITDFGLARAAADASVSQSGVVCGTPQYMAPEQARCEAVDPRADLFSLGP